MIKTTQTPAPQTAKPLSNSAIISRLKPQHTKQAASVLSQAFAEYPITQYLFSECPEEAPSRFRVMFEYLIDSRHVRGFPVLGCFIDSKLIGVAVVSEPGEGWSTPELDERYRQATEVFGPLATQRFEKYGDLCDETIPSWSHHYLGILGVLPQYQGHGYGINLVEAVKNEAASHPTSEGVCLNTEAPENLRFYEKCGFQIYKDHPVDEIRTWGMVLKQD